MTSSDPGASRAIPPVFSAALLRDVLNAAPDAMLVADEDGCILFCSAPISDVLGYAPEELIGQSIEGLVPGVLRAGAAAPGSRSELERTVRHRDGSEFTSQVSLARVQSEGRARVVVAMRRVSERERTELPFQAVLEAAPDAMVIVDHNGEMILVNAQTEQLFGFSRSELLGKPVEMLMPECFRGAHSKHRVDFFSRPMFRAMGASVELTGMRRDGSELPVEISLSPIETGDGLLVVAAIRDVSEHLRAQEKFRSLLESAPDAWVIVDQEGRIALVNAEAERLFGYSRSEMIGQRVELLVPGELRAKHVEHRAVYLRNLVSRRMGAHLRLQAVRKDGSRVPVEIGLSPLQTESGLLISAVIRDVTERRQTERDMERALRLAEHSGRELEAFSYAAAHDLRAPLRGIEGYGAALLEEYAEKLDETGQHYVARMRAASCEMAERVDALLHLAQLNRGELIRQPVDLSALARGVVARLVASDPERSVDVSIEDGLTAQGDPGLLEALCENLLANAWKFTRTRERARIAFGWDPCEGVFYVRDDGVGFDMAFASKLFVAFQRLHAASEFEGTGVGLATVQRIVQRHGGHIWGRAEVDRGAAFYFTLGPPGDED